MPTLHLYVALFHTETKNRGTVSKSQPFPLPRGWQHRTEINRWGAGKVPLALGRSHGPVPALPGDPGGQHTSSVEDKPHRALPSSSSAAPKDWGERAAAGTRVAQPRGDRFSPRRGSEYRLPGPLNLGGTQHPRLLRIDLVPITGSGPKCSWLGNEGCSRGGGMVATPPSLLTLQLEADAAGLGPGQPGGRRWGPSVPLCLAGAS